MRKPIVAGNWKCNLLTAEAAGLVKQLRGAGEPDGVEVVVCPAYTSLPAVAQLLVGSAIGLGSQDLYWEPKGAFTGEVSGPMLRDLGCRYVIVGHSERRALFGETDEWVRKKLTAALAHQLTPIVCVGETLAQREAGKTLEVVERQLSGALFGMAAAECERIVLAYEPVWAIGTGRTATPEQAQEAHQAIRAWLKRSIGAHAAEAIRIQYGGSVTAENAGGLMRQPDVDGALVGGASVKAESFGAIVKAAQQKQAVTK
jgi:triosephosphate isomerase